ncbi:MAG: D-alanyl-D-alanine carboxypeptidase [Actinomycetota bacterium]|nr:D-alanyl-D-alanine carboxypeptidase [Actinomycetota bacterium]
MKKVYVYEQGKIKQKNGVKSRLNFFLGNQSKILAAICIAILVLILVSFGQVIAGSKITNQTSSVTKRFTTNAAKRMDPPGLMAKSAVLMDAESGRVLFEKNPNLRLPMASTTKMMTAIVAREKLKLDKQVQVSAKASEVGEKEIWLEPGEVFTVENLLWALLVQSANDAAIALAEAASGDMGLFVDRMNAKAREIGALNTNFKNPHGLDEKGHYSTAYDLAIIGRTLMQDSLLARMVSSREHALPWEGHPNQRICQSHNTLLQTYPGANGIKTGYTKGAGSCIVASAKRENKFLIAVIMSSEQRDLDASRLLDYGFLSTGRVVVAKRGEPLGKTRVSAFPECHVRAVAKKEMAVLVLKGRGETVLLKTKIKSEAEPPIEKGEKLGNAVCWVGDLKISEEEVVAEEAKDKVTPPLSAAYVLWYTLCKFGEIVSSPFRTF